VGVRPTDRNDDEATFLETGLPQGIAQFNETHSQTVAIGEPAARGAPRRAVGLDIYTSVGVRVAAEAQQMTPTGNRFRSNDDDDVDSTASHGSPGSVARCSSPRSSCMSIERAVRGGAPPAAVLTGHARAD